MHTVITNSFGLSTNVGDYAIIVATINLLRSVTPEKPIYVMPWQFISSDMESRFYSLLDRFQNVYLMNPFLPAPSNPSPFPSSSVWGKVHTLAWSVYANIRAELGSRYPLGEEIHRNYKVFREADRIILRGCNIVQRGNNLRALASIRRVTFPLHIAQQMDKPIVLLNISVGPVENPLARRMVRKMLEKAEYISVREPFTLEYLKGFAVYQPILSSDTAFALPFHLPCDLQREPCLVGMNLLSIGEFLGAVQSSRQIYEVILENLAVELNLLMRRNPKLSILGIPHEMDRVNLQSDLLQMRKLVSMLAHPERVIILETAVRPEDVVSAYARCSVVIGMRFHGYVLASLAGTPMIGIDLNSRKVHGIADALGVGDLMVNLWQRGHLVEQVSKALSCISELQTIVSANAYCLRQVVFDSWSEFVRSSETST